MRIGFGEPVSIDPYNAQESGGQLIVKLVFAGLVQLQADGTLRGETAKSWSHDGECGTWTFLLRPDAKFSSGEAVTASSFVRGWNRAAKQAAASDVAGYLSGIEGFDAVHGSENQAATGETMSGAVAKDDHTLEVKLSAPDCEFDKRTLHAVFSPVPSDAGEYDNAAFNNLPVGNGPYKLAEPWQHNRSITVVRNEQWTGPEPAIERVEFVIGDLANHYRSFQAKELDFANVPLELVGQASEQYGDGKGYLEVPAYGLTYLVVSPNNPPLHNAAARRAISAAIDRRQLIDGVMKQPLKAADSIVPPAFANAYTPGQCESCTFDLGRARAWAAEGGLSAGTRVKLAYNADGGNQGFVEAIGGQLEEHLGLDIELVAVPLFTDYLQALQAPDSSGLFRLAWNPDFPSPLNIVEPLVGAEGAGNLAGYRSDLVDDLLRQASEATDDATRLPLLQKAEKAALDDMPVIPLWYGNSFVVYDATKWSNVRMDFFGNPDIAAVTRR